MHTIVLIQDGCQLQEVMSLCCIHSTTYNWENIKLQFGCIILLWNKSTSLPLNNGMSLVKSLLENQPYYNLESIFRVFKRKEMKASRRLIILYVHAFLFCWHFSYRTCALQKSTFWLFAATTSCITYKSSPCDLENNLESIFRVFKRKEMKASRRLAENDIITRGVTVKTQQVAVRGSEDE
jgi:hypothetical protein